MLPESKKSPCTSLLNETDHDEASLSYPFIADCSGGPEDSCLDQSDEGKSLRVMCDSDEAIHSVYTNHAQNECLDEQILDSLARSAETDLQSKGFDEQIIDVPTSPAGEDLNETESVHQQSFVNFTEIEEAEQAIAQRYLMGYHDDSETLHQKNSWTSSGQIFHLHL